MKSKMLWTLAIALMISISLITLTPIYGKKPPETLLTEEELAMAQVRLTKSEFSCIDYKNLKNKELQ